jgi:translation initiation factor 2 subunit 3
VGKAGSLPLTVNEITLEYHSLERTDLPKQSFRQSEPLILGIGTGTSVGYIQSIKKNKLDITLNHHACIDKKAKIAVMRNFGQRWKLSGFGILL